MELHSFISWLLYSSLMGSILVGFILVIRLIVMKRLGEKWKYLLWFLLIAKLVLPYAPESSFSVYNLLNHFPSASSSGTYFTISPNDGINQLLKTATAVENIVGANDDYYLSVNRIVTDFKDRVLFVVWLSGAIGFSCLLVCSTRKLKAVIDSSSRVNERSLCQLLEECKELLQINSHLILIESSVFRSPKIVWVMHPYILLPMGLAASCQGEDLRYILLHELAHWRRKDLYVNWFIALLQIIHWFNPLIWYAFYRMRQDRELACDATVLSLLQPDEYKRYGRSIIAFAEFYSQNAYNDMAAGLASSKKNIKNRISMIASYKKETTGSFIGKIALVLLLGCLVLTNAKLATSEAQTGSNEQASTVYEDLSSFFDGYDGTFVLLDLEKDHYSIYNKVNSEKRISPDSTYKIVSSLMGLENHVISLADNRIVWDGTSYLIEQWNRDQTLTSAMQYSVNWYFQRLDAAAGKGRIESSLRTIGYGNHDLSGGIHDFWIESSLKISPIEQVEILKRLYNDELPFSRENIGFVKDTIKVFAQDGVALYGKTGTGDVNGKLINGWFVGWVERQGKVFVFATNIQASDRADGANAKKITVEILKNKGIL